MSNAGAGAQPSRAQTLRPVIALVVTCAVASALLAGVHQLTAPLAAANAEQRAQEIYAMLMPSATSFESVPCEVDGCVDALEALDSSGTVVGYVVVAQAKGYGGQVPIAVAFETSNTVAGIVAMGNSETPGLGTRIADDAYIGQYLGLPAQQAGEQDIDFISGATISSKAALKAFNTAVEAYEEVRS